MLRALQERESVWHPFNRELAAVYNSLSKAHAMVGEDAAAAMRALQRSILVEERHNTDGGGPPLAMQRFLYLQLAERARVEHRMPGEQGEMTAYIGSELMSRVMHTLFLHFGDRFARFLDEYVDHFIARCS